MERFIKQFLPLILLFLVISALVLPASAEVRSEMKNGMLRFYDSVTQETLHVMSPVRLVVDFDVPAGANVTDSAAGKLWFTSVNSGAPAIVQATGGVLRMTNGSADDDDSEFGTGLLFSPQKYCAIEARVRINTATCGFNFGFSDARNQAVDYLAVNLSGVTLDSQATDCAMFFSDYDATTNDFRTVTVAGDVDGATTTTGTAFDFSDYHIYRVEINPEGDVDFWFDGDHIRTAAAAITNNVPLCGYFGIINRSGAAVNADIDYLRAWQRR